MSWTDYFPAYGLESFEEEAQPQRFKSLDQYYDVYKRSSEKIPKENTNLLIVYQDWFGRMTLPFEVSFDSSTQDLEIGCWQDAEIEIPTELKVLKEQSNLLVRVILAADSFVIGVPPFIDPTLMRVC